jgi:hypothetical protein
VQLVAQIYLAVCLVAFVGASLLKAPHRVVMEFALCFGLGWACYIGIDSDIDGSFWTLVIFGGFIVLPFLDWRGRSDAVGSRDN